MKTSLILCSDGYKYSQFKQYDPEITGMFSYIEARANRFREDQYADTRIHGTLFFGLQAFIKEYLTVPLTHQDIDEAKALIGPYIGIFPEEGFRKIVDKYNGLFPVVIKAVKEGTIVPFGNILASIECYDPELFWVASFLETAMLRSIWYPTTVSTVSRLCKDIIRTNLEKTAEDLSGLPFKLHDFGARGASSHETAMLGGMAHLVNFLGTDTVEALQGMAWYYDGKENVGFSIPASEHSTMTSWGKDRETEAYRNMIDQFKGNGIFACVSDAYDIFNATENIWGGSLKEEVQASQATIVIRPDSGDPVSTCLKVVRILDEKFGATVNSKGFRVLNNVRIIQGDGINPEVIRSILFAFEINQYSGDNIAFGMGGALLQQVSRDTFSFAQKCSLVQLKSGEYREVFKDPVGGGKKSKTGYLSLIKDEGKFKTIAWPTPDPVEGDLLVTKYSYGEVVGSETIYEIREQAGW